MYQEFALCAEALASVFEHYLALCATWVDVKDTTKDPVIGAWIDGIVAQMEKFNFLFGADLGPKA